MIDSAMPRGYEIAAQRQWRFGARCYIIPDIPLSREEPLEARAAQLRALRADARSGMAHAAVTSGRGSGPPCPEGCPQIGGERAVSDAREMSAAELAEKLGAKRSGQGWMARCPAHEDHTPSLKIDEGEDGKILLYCHAGCEFANVVAGIERDYGLRWRPDGKKGSARQRPEPQPEPQDDWQPLAFGSLTASDNQSRRRDAAAADAGRQIAAERGVSLPRSDADRVHAAAQDCEAAMRAISPSAAARFTCGSSASVPARLPRACGGIGSIAQAPDRSVSSRIHS
jgi:hypothetical protein